MAEDKTKEPNQETPQADVKPDAKEPVVEPKDATETAVRPPAKKKRKAKRNVPAGQVHIKATFNNTIISVTDSKGEVLVQSSAGGCGFKGSKKGTAYAAQVATDKALEKAISNYGLKKADLYVRGVGLGRDAAARTVAGSNMAVDSVTDKTGLPHGGCRPRKPRRV